MKKCEEDGTDPFLAILEYRNTPISSDLGSPAQLLQSRRLRSVLPTIERHLKPEIQVHTKAKLQRLQCKTKTWFNKNKKRYSKLRPGEKVRFQKHRKKHFQEGRIIQEAQQPRSYTVEDVDGNIYRRNRTFFIRKPQQKEQNSIHSDEQNRNANVSQNIDTPAEQTNAENTVQTDTESTEHTHSTNRPANTGQKHSKHYSPVKITSRGRTVVKPLKYRE